MYQFPIFLPTSVLSFNKHFCGFFKHIEVFFYLNIKQEEFGPVGWRTNPTLALITTEIFHALGWWKLAWWVCSALHTVSPHYSAVWSAVHRNMKDSHCCCHHQFLSFLIGMRNDQHLFITAYDNTLQLISQRRV